MAVFIFIWKFHIAWFFKTVVIVIISFTLFFKEESSGQLFPDLPGPTCAGLRMLQRMWLRGVYLSRSIMHCYFKMVVTHFMIVTKNDILECFFFCEYMVNTLPALFFSFNLYYNLLIGMAL